MSPSQDLLKRMGTDAAVWAHEYELRFPLKTPDWGTLLAWFANAIEAGKSDAVDPEFVRGFYGTAAIDNHEHKWVNMDNEIISGGWFVCTRCGKIGAEIPDES